MKFQRSKILIILISVAVGIAAGLGAFSIVNKSKESQVPSYTAVATAFVGAIQQKNSSKVSSLETARFKNWVFSAIKASNHAGGSQTGGKIVPVSDSFYDWLQDTYNPDFSDLSGAKVTHTSYGKHGEEVDYNYYTCTGPPHSGPAVHFRTYVGLDLVKMSDGSWLVDNFQDNTACAD